jgi:hypothetical protein
MRIRIQLQKKNADPGADPEPASKNNADLGAAPGTNPDPASKTNADRVRIRIQLPKIMRVWIRIQLPKIMRIRIQLSNIMRIRVRIRIQLPKIMRIRVQIRIQLPKTMRIRIRNPGCDWYEPPSDWLQAAGADGIGSVPSRALLRLHHCSLHGAAPPSRPQALPRHAPLHLHLKGSFFEFFPSNILVF